MAKLKFGAWIPTYAWSGKKTDPRNMRRIHESIVKCEKYGIDIEFHCKPLGDTDWNGSGMHANFSTKYMREVGGKDYFEKLMAAFDKNLMDHIAVYGPDNDKRLTGQHETAPYNEYSYGVSNRGASVRIPWQVEVDKKGYIEDRRPNANCDPYEVTHVLIETICGALAE